MRQPANAKSTRLMTRRLKQTAAAPFAIGLFRAKSWLGWKAIIRAL